LTDGAFSSTLAAMCCAAARERRVGLGLMGLGGVPFVVGRLAYGVSNHSVTGVSTWCPFRALTGLPCPLCGATRAIVLASHGDMSMFRFNAAWVAVAVLTFLVGFAGLTFSLIRRTPLHDVGRSFVSLRAERPRLVTAILVTSLVVPWGYALTHRQFIVT